MNFWYESFNKLPFPIFIKEFNRGVEQNEHVIINKAMRDFESSDFENKRFHGEIDERLKDYIKGDSITYEKGFFKQIELCMNMEEGIKPSTILTIKNLLIYKDKSYIVGTYIPIEPKRLSNKNVYKIKYSNGQLILPISESSNSDHTIDIKIGDAIKAKNRK